MDEFIMVEYIIEINEVDVFENIVQDINTFISENLGKHYFINDTIYLSSSIFFLIYYILYFVGYYLF
jgi:hypothetical protein